MCNGPMPKPDDDDYFGYLAIQTVKAHEFPSFAFGKREVVERARVIWSGKSPVEADPEDNSASEEEAQPDFTHSSTLTEALAKSIDFGLEQYQLLGTASIVPQLFRTITAVGVVLKPCQESADKLEDDEVLSIFGLTEEQYLDLVARTDRYNQMKEGLKNIPSAIFLGLIASFDSLIVEILERMLRLNKWWLERSNRTIPLGSLATASDLESLIDEAVADEIYQFSRGSHDEQAKYIENQFGVGIRDHWRRWPDYIEVFERRNLVAHGEKYFNKRYVSICKNAGHKGSDKLLGQEVLLRDDYLNQSLEILVEFSALLSFQLWRKAPDSDEDQAFTNLSEAVFKLTQNGRYKVAERLADFGLNLKGTKVAENTRLIMLVNRASALRHDKREDEATALLDTVDWSAASNVFKACVAAVRADADGFISLLPRLKGGEDILPRSFVEWPCFEFVRNEEKVRAALVECFGESSVKTVQKAADLKNAQSDDQLDAEADDSLGGERPSNLH